MAGRFTVEAVFKATDRFSGVMGTFQAKLGKFAGGARAQLDKLDKLGASVANGMKTAAIGLAAGTAVAATSLTAAAMPGLDFGEAIASVGAVSLKSRDQIADLEAEARKLGLTTKFSATEVAKGMETMGRAGFTNAEVIQGIAPMLSAAAAEGAEFEPVAEVVSSVIKGMGLAMSETGRVADVLTLASAETKSSIISLGESLATAGPMAKQFNIPLEQVTASVALLQDVGLDASVAGSAVGTMLNNLANPSKEARGEMQALGISFQDAKGNMLPLERVFQQFAKGSEKAGGNMKQVAFFADLLGLRGQKAGQNLRDAFKSGKFKDLTDKLQNAAGSAEKMASVRLDQTKGDLTILKNNALDLGITLFDISSNKLRGVIQSTTKWVQANREVIATMAGNAFEKFLSGLETAKAAITVFADGAERGFQRVSGPFMALGGLFNTAGEWRGTLFNVGEAAGALVPIFFGLIVGGKALRIVLFGVEVATKGVTAAVWLVNIAYRAYTAATVLWTLASQQGLRVALATLATTRLGTAATWLANAARGAWALVTQGAAAVETLFIGQITAGTAATEAATVATEAATLSLGPLLLALGATAAAIGAVMVAWSQWQDLQKAAGGHVWEGIKGVFNGKGFFGGVDEAMNEDARREAQKTAAAGASPAADGFTPAGAIPAVNAPGTAPGSDAGGDTAPGAPALPPAAQGPQADAETQAMFAQLLPLLTANAQKDAKSVVELRIPQGVTADVKTPKAGVRNPVKVTQSGGAR